MYGCLLLLFGYLAWMYHSKAAAFLAIAGVFLYLLMKILLLIQEKRVDVRSVSYTHLDVYKRQLQHR